MSFWQKFLEKLAQANKQSFGEERLDCCNLNRTDAVKPEAQPKKQQ